MRSLSLAATLLLAACQSTEPQLGSAAIVAARSSCIPVVAVGDWQIIDDAHILIWSDSLDWAHRATLARPLAGLRLEEVIGVIDADGDGAICANGKDGILTGECRGTPVSMTALERLTVGATRAAVRGAVPNGGRKPTVCSHVH